MRRVPFESLKALIRSSLTAKGVDYSFADECAQLFAQASLDGVPSHGLNFVERYLNFIDEGWIKPNNMPTLVDSKGFFEQYDGNLGLGNLNAKRSMDRAVTLAKLHGVGIVGLRNTNHWTRGGHYGWQAAEAGCMGICWTNTESIMPPWGSRETRIGNNPLVLSVPRAQGHLVLDTSMAQFSYGKIEQTRRAGERLPMVGGYNEHDDLTDDPEEIEATKRVLPAGYWKGSGLAIMLDAFGAVLSGGRSTKQVDNFQPKSGVGCYGVSQVFVAIDPQIGAQQSFIEHTVDDIVNYVLEAEPARPGGDVSYPGHATTQRRRVNLQEGVPCDEDVLERLLKLTPGASLET